MLLERIFHEKPISGTQKLHVFLPTNRNKITVKPYIFSKDSREEKVRIYFEVW